VLQARDDVGRLRWCRCLMELAATASELCPASTAAALNEVNGKLSRFLAAKDARWGRAAPAAAAVRALTLTPTPPCRCAACRRRATPAAAAAVTTLAPPASPTAHTF
jgi:hypothetical protein